MTNKTFANAGDSTFEEYKAMINKMMNGIVGRDANYTEEEWQKNYKTFIARMVDNERRKNERIHNSRPTR